MRALRRGQYREVAGVYYGTPKELWGFRTRPLGGSPGAIGRQFAEANARLLGLTPNLAGLEGPKVLESLGAYHVIFQQRHLGRRIHRAYVTVHADRSGRVYLAKNRAVPESLLPRKVPPQISASDAAGRAIRALPRLKRRARVVSSEEVWFPRERTLIAAWRIQLSQRRPAEDWIVYVSARGGGILSKYDNLSLSRGSASIFDPSPVTALGGHDRLISHGGRPRNPPELAYRKGNLFGLAGTGFLEGVRVTTGPTKGRVRKRDANFCCRSGDPGFEEAMVYYHVDAAIRYLGRLGYRGRREIFRSPVKANVNGTHEDNSWYSPHERLLTYGTGWIDDAEDGETILHELGHAIQDAIVPGFGQSAEAAAMGEGFGDYFAGSMFAERKPPAYRDTVMSWDGLLIGLEQGMVPPCLRRLDSDLTYAQFQPDGDEHDNGLIWSAVLWDIRGLLGRRVADTLIVESHFQLDGFTTFARGARAILDADRNLYRGVHVAALKQGFQRRRIGPI